MWVRKGWKPEGTGSCVCDGVVATLKVAQRRDLLPLRCLRTGLCTLTTFLVCSVQVRARRTIRGLPGQLVPLWGLCGPQGCPLTCQNVGYETTDERAHLPGTSILHEASEGEMLFFFLLKQTLIFGIAWEIQVTF